MRGNPRILTGMTQRRYFGSTGLWTIRRRQTWRCQGPPHGAWGWCQSKARQAKRWRETFMEKPCRHLDSTVPEVNKLWICQLREPITSSFCLSCVSFDSVPYNENSPNWVHCNLAPNSDAIQTKKLVSHFFNSSLNKLIKYSHGLIPQRIDHSCKLIYAN